MGDKLKVIFMGTPDFAVPCLEKLTDMDLVEVIGVVTQPDRPRGRGQKMIPSPVKACALEKGIEVYQPEKIKTPEFTEKLREMTPDLMVVVAFGQILSQAILDIPKYGCVNVHGSLLPRYRGAAPIHWAIINGETKTGITTMYMDAGLDTGDMLIKAETEIGPDMTTEELHDKLMMEGAKVLEETVLKIADGTIERQKQDDSISNYAPLLKKDTGHIDWSKSAEEIHNLVRGLNSWPGAYAMLQGEKFKIWGTKAVSGISESAPGTILEGDGKQLLVSTGNGIIEITELQAPSKKKMPAAEYLKGHKLSAGSVFE